LGLPRALPTGFLGVVFPEGLLGNGGFGVVFPEGFGGNFFLGSLRFSGPFGGGAPMGTPSFSRLPGFFFGFFGGFFLAIITP
jgi:hypothetical protein